MEMVMDLKSVKEIAYSKEGVNAIYELYSKGFNIDEIYNIFTGEKSAYNIIKDNIEILIETIIDELGKNSKKANYYQNCMCYNCDIEDCVNEDNPKLKILDSLDDIKDKVKTDIQNESFNEFISNKIDEISKKLSNINEAQIITEKIKNITEENTDEKLKKYIKHFIYIGKMNSINNNQMTIHKSIIDKEQWEIINKIINNKKG